MDPIKRAIGARIRERRLDKGYTQEKLAEKSGISPNYLSSIERGICFPRMHNLVTLMNCLECSADEIFCDVIDKAYAIREERINERMDNLSKTERNRILRVMEALLETYEE